MANNSFLESRNYRFSPIQELDEANVVERFKSPQNQNLCNKRLPSLSRKSRCYIQKANTQPRKDNSESKLSPTPSVCSKCLEKYSFNEEPNKLKYRDQISKGSLSKEKLSTTYNSSMLKLSRFTSPRIQLDMLSSRKCSRNCSISKSNSSLTKHTNDHC